MSALRKAMREVVQAERQKPMKPCKNGHVGIRYACGHCVECDRTLSVDRRDYMREYMREYRRRAKR
jgi:bacterioferritin-associated ferredoxin